MITCLLTVLTPYPCTYLLTFSVIIQNYLYIFPDHLWNNIRNVIQGAGFWTFDSEEIEIVLIHNSLLTFCALISASRSLKMKHTPYDCNLNKAKLYVSKTSFKDPPNVAFFRSMVSVVGQGHNRKNSNTRNIQRTQTPPRMWPMTLWCDLGLSSRSRKLMSLDFAYNIVMYLDHRYDFYGFKTLRNITICLFHVTFDLHLWPFARSLKL